MTISAETKDVMSTLFNQVFRLISGPLTMVLIANHLNESQQGYWYLFLGVSALTTLADMGFATIVLQFVAHEFANLKLNSRYSLEGHEFHINKMGSLFQFTIKWISISCLLVFPVIYFVGLGFFFRDSVVDVYIIPWTFYSLGSLINFFSIIIMTFLEGMDLIFDIQNIRILISFFNTIVLALMLIFNMNIHALAFSTLFSGVLISFVLFKKYKNLFFQLLSQKKTIMYDWKNQIVPLFIRYSLSTISGYFIFQTFVPIVQYFKGSIETGKVGISLALISAIFTVSNIWIYTIIPKINIMISKKNKKELDILFYNRLSFAIITYLAVSFILLVSIFFLKNIPFFSEFIKRFVSLFSFIILLICYFFQLLINAWATYLRAHKIEPYMTPSIILAIWVVAATSIVAKFLPVQYIFVGFLLSYIWWIPLSRFIFKKKSIEIYGKS